jgi:hypothetical protein
MQKASGYKKKKKKNGWLGGAGGVACRASIEALSSNPSATQKRVWLSNQN